MIANEGRVTAFPGSATGRLRLAIPNKGRMQQPTLDLLHDAGLRFEDGTVCPVLFLRGKSRELVDNIEREMDTAAAEERFEDAARLRDRLQAVERTIDLVTAIVLFMVLGWQWILLPGLIMEAIPGLYVFPFWVLVVGAVVMWGTAWPKLNA